MKSGIELKRLGTVAADIVEANPVVFGGRLYRFEYIRESNAGNTTGSSFSVLLMLLPGAARRLLGEVCTWGVPLCLTAGCMSAV